MLLSLLFAWRALAATVTADKGITYNGVDNGDGTTSFTVFVPSSANANWVGIGFGAGMSSDQLHIVWNTGSGFAISDHTGQSYNGNINQLSLVSGAVDGSGNWNVVIKRTSNRLPFGPGATGSFLWALSTGGVITSSDPSTSLPFHSGGFGQLTGPLIDSTPALPVSSLPASPSSSPSPETLSSSVASETSVVSSITTESPSPAFPSSVSPTFSPTTTTTTTTTIQRQSSITTSSDAVTTATAPADLPRFLNDQKPGPTLLNSAALGYLARSFVAITVVALV
ncbi:hypothetical protein BC830DRAFT_1103538 [Chytriomyces sp. MP71]|nr:hypothetical protein BC830DRAFT_1103538 [Chytriomyces sp. MP71]